MGAHFGHLDGAGAMAASWGGVGFRSEDLKCMQFWHQFLRICRGKPQILGQVSDVLMQTHQIAGLKWGLGCSRVGTGGAGYMRAYFKYAFTQRIRDVAAGVRL